MISKSELRTVARQRRAALAAAMPEFAEVLARHAAALKIAPGSVVGGYHALPDEADPALLLERLVERHAMSRFPRVARREAALEFHKVPDGEVLRPGMFGVHEPLEHWPRAIPQVLLVPLLAFDAGGHRLGYGGGFYDRTLKALNVRAIGIAYAGQETPSLPREPHDRAVDAILTEKGLRLFTRRKE